MISKPTAIFHGDLSAILVFHANNEGVGPRPFI